MSSFNRRNFLITSAFFSSLIGLGKIWHSQNKDNPVIPGQIVGASFALGHRLRDGKFPSPSRTIQKKAVIIGGGIAGLSAAWKLNKSGFQDFMLLELEKQVGGNAGFGQNSVSAYPWGAHYVPLLSEESAHARELFHELGIITGYQGKLPIYNDYYLSSDPQERLFMYGRWQEGFVPHIGVSQTDHAQYRSFFAAMENFKELKGSDGKKVFVIPVDKSSTDATWRQLDHISMADYLTQNGWTSEYLRWYVNYCCRDDYGATMEEVSAWAGIHYFASRTGKAANADSGTVITWPEGNGWIVKQLKNRLANYLHTHAVATKVEHKENNLQVLYYDVTKNQTIAIETEAVIFATSRFIAERLFSTGLNLNTFEYRPWLVANITLDRLPEGRGFPLAWDNMIYHSRFLGYINATHQNLNRVQLETVLTYYYPLSELPAKQARRWAIQQSQQDWSKLILSELLLIHPELENHIKQLDVCVWGHGMICPKPGFIWGNNRKQALQQTPPIFYAHSDMSGISIFEEANYQGVQAAEKLMRYLNHRFKVT